MDSLRNKDLLVRWLFYGGRGGMIFVNLTGYAGRADLLELHLVPTLAHDLFVIRNSFARQPRAVYLQYWALIE